MQNKKVKQSRAIEEVKVQKNADVPNSHDQPANKFSYGKIGKYCKNGRFCDRIGAGTPVFMAAVLEYITEEIVLLAETQLKAEHSNSKKKERINPRHIMLAIRSDVELNKFFKSGHFCASGVKPTLEKPNKKKGEMGDDDSEDDDYLSD